MKWEKENGDMLSPLPSEPWRDSHSIVSFQVPELLCLSSENAILNKVNFEFYSGTLS